MQYKEKYARLEDEEDDELVAPERLMHKKRRDSDLSSSGEEGFNFYGLFDRLVVHGPQVIGRIQLCKGWIYLTE